MTGFCKIALFTHSRHVVVWPRASADQRDIGRGAVLDVLQSGEHRHDVALRAVGPDRRAADVRRCWTDTGLGRRDDVPRGVPADDRRSAQAAALLTDGGARCGGCRRRGRDLHRVGVLNQSMSASPPPRSGGKADIQRPPLGAKNGHAARRLTSRNEPQPRQSSKSNVGCCSRCPITLRCSRMRQWMQTREKRRRRGCGSR